MSFVDNLDWIFPKLEISGGWEKMPHKKQERNLQLGARDTGWNPGYILTDSIEERRGLVIGNRVNRLNKAQTVFSFNPVTNSLCPGKDRMGP